jgi:hypothetical protein
MSQPVLTSKQFEVLVRLKVQAKKIKGECEAQMSHSTFTPGRLHQGLSLLVHLY